MVLPGVGRDAAHIASKIHRRAPAKAAHPPKGRCDDDSTSRSYGRPPTPPRQASAGCSPDAGDSLRGIARDPQVAATCSDSTADYPRPRSERRSRGSATGLPPPEPRRAGPRPPPPGRGRRARPRRRPVGRHSRRRAGDGHAATGPRVGHPRGAAAPGRREGRAPPPRRRVGDARARTRPPAPRPGRAGLSRHPAVPARQRRDRRRAVRLRARARPGARRPRGAARLPGAPRRAERGDRPRPGRRRPRKARDAAGRARRRGRRGARGGRLGGRARAFAAPPERARTAVRKAIKRAVDTITDHDPALGAELRTAVETGAHCRYTPAGSRRWTIHWR